MIIVLSQNKNKPKKSITYLFSILKKVDESTRFSKRRKRGYRDWNLVNTTAYMLGKYSDWLSNYGAPYNQFFTRDNC